MSRGVRFCGVLGFVTASVVTPAPAQPTAVGLSPVRAQRFVADAVLGYEPQASDDFGAALAAGDFNGDGGCDLATGSPEDDGLAASPVADSGTVFLRYGVPEIGLVPGVSDSLLNQSAPGSPDPAEAGDRFGASLAACDWNGDGFDDLAVGVPGEDVLAATPDSGAVDIYFGTLGGLPATANQHWSLESPGIPGDADAFESFGAALACGDFDADGFDDLAIGSPGRAFVLPGGGFLPQSGSILILYGTLSGLAAADAAALDQNSPGVEGEAEGLDYFGSALAVGDFDSDGFADLAVGVPGEDNPGVGAPGAPQNGRGAVAVLFGGPSGIAAADDLVRTESELGGTSETGDRLGSALAVGDFDGDGFDDLAIGIPFEDFNGSAIVAAGQAVTIYGAAMGFDFARTQFWNENVLSGPGAVEPGDTFGLVLAAGDFDGDGYAELAIGQPGEFDGVAGDGAAAVILGSSAGLAAESWREFACGQEGLPGIPHAPSRFLSRALASGDFDGDGYTDLALGAPGEEVAGVFAAGAEIVLYGAGFADGFDAGTSGSWDQVVP